METGLLIGLVFPGGEVVFLAGIAASGSGAAALGDAKLSTPLLFTLAPIAAIVGGEVGYWFGKKYGGRFDMECAFVLGICYGEESRIVCI